MASPVSGGLGGGGSHGHLVTHHQGSEREKQSNQTAQRLRGHEALQIKRLFPRKHEIHGAG